MTTVLMYVTVPLALLAAIGACSRGSPVESEASAPSSASSFASTPAATPAAAPEIAGGSLRDALALGAKTGRNVLLEYYGENCPYCRQMDRGALADAAAKAALTDVVYVRMTKGKDAASFEQRFGRQATPTFVAMKPDGSVLGRPVSGVVRPPDFARFVAWAKTGEEPMPDVSGAGG